MHTTHHKPADPAARYMLETFPNAYGAHGFVYVEWFGTIIAAGGDAPIVVGIYADDDALADGDPIAYREWHDTTPDSIIAAIAMIDEHADDATIAADIADMHN